MGASIPQNRPFPWGSGPPSYTYTFFLGSTRVLNPNSMLIASAVFAGLTSVIDWLTDHATRSVTVGRIYLRSTVMWPKMALFSDFGWVTDHYFLGEAIAECATIHVVADVLLTTLLPSCGTLPNVYILHSRHTRSDVDTQHVFLVTSWQRSTTIWTLSVSKGIHIFCYFILTSYQTHIGSRNIQKLFTHLVLVLCVLFIL